MPVHDCNFLSAHFFKTSHNVLEYKSNADIWYEKKNLKDLLFFNIINIKKSIWIIILLNKK